MTCGVKPLTHATDCGIQSCWLPHLTPRVARPSRRLFEAGLKAPRRQRKIWGLLLLQSQQGVHTHTFTHDTPLLRPSLLLITLMAIAPFTSFYFRASHTPAQRALFVCHLSSRRFCCMRQYTIVVATPLSPCVRGEVRTHFHTRISATLWRG